MRFAPSLSLIAVIAFAAACSKKEAVSEPAAAAPPTAAAPAATPVPAPTPAAPPSVPGEITSGDHDKAMAELGKAFGAVGESIQAAAAQSSGDVSGDPCERAYESVVAMVEAMQKQFNKQSPRRLDRAKFVEGCHELPVPAQQCLVIGYAMSHQEECKRITDAVDPATRQKVEAMMRGSIREAAPR